MQNVAADELHIEVPHVQDSFAGFASDSESFGKDVVQGRAVFEALFEFGCFGLELGIGKSGNARFQSVDLHDDRLDFLKFPLAPRPYDLVNQTFKHRGV